MDENGQMIAALRAAAREVLEDMDADVLTVGMVWSLMPALRGYAPAMQWEQRRDDDDSMDVLVVAINEPELIERVQRTIREFAEEHGAAFEKAHEYTGDGVRVDGGGEA